MKKITITISTRNRLEKLKNTLNSIPDLDYIETFIICDGDKESYKELKKFKKSNLEVFLSKKHKGSVYCRNILNELVNDGLLYAVDDIIFEENSIQSAFKTFNNTFTYDNKNENDGVVGFVVTNTKGDFHPSGVALIGHNFLLRYPNRQLFCPSYYHFSCQDIYRHAVVLNKFIQDKEAKIFHHHPAFYPDLIDLTHIEARKYIKEDMKLKKKFEKENKIWGYNYFGE